MESALSAFCKVLARILALPESNTLVPVPSSLPRASLATSMTAFKSSALSALENTAVKFSASWAPKSDATSITSFMESALSAFCKVLERMDALLESNTLVPVPSSLPRVSVATSITALRSSALSALENTAVKFSAS